MQSRLNKRKRTGQRSFTLSDQSVVFEKLLEKS